MALTRRFLESLGLEEAAVEAVIQAHVEVTDALKHERETWRQKAEEQAGAAAAQMNDPETEGAEAPTDAVEPAAVSQDERLQVLQAEFDAYKARVEADRLRGEKLTALRGALREAGVQREDFAELLTRAVDLEAVEVNSGRISDPEAVIGPLRAAYGGCFAATFAQGTPPLDPPSAVPRALTREAIARMSVEDINQHWDQVKLALEGS